MTVQYLWAVNGMTAYPEHEGQEDVVFNVQWCCNGSEDDVHGVVYGSTDVTYDPTQPFTSYDGLTIEQVIGWVHEALGAEEVTKKEEEVAQQIADKKVPPKEIVKPLPWNVSTPEPIYFNNDGN